MTNKRALSGAGSGLRPEVSVIIKAYNEEANIGRSIASALAALGPLGGEVILADGLSEDRTVEVAATYPVIIVQLRNAVDRCCGAGPQLGFQYAEGEFIYVLDGDMELDPSFLRRGVAFLRSHPDVAGVAGIVEELGGGNYEFEARKRSDATWATPGVQTWFDMGGLYRREAIERVGYLSNRNLHACEEEELGHRLQQTGARLVRLPIPSVRHHGRCEATLPLMMRRLRSGYSDGPGELIRSSLGTPYAARAARGQQTLLAMAGAWLLTLVSAAFLPWTPWPLVAMVVLQMTAAAAMLVRKHNPWRAALGYVNWQLRTLGLVRGLLRRQIPPTQRLASRLLSQPSTEATHVTEATRSS